MKLWGLVEPNRVGKAVDPPTAISKTSTLWRTRRFRGVRVPGTKRATLLLHISNGGVMVYAT